jgi:glycosyltransferase involved in cell wall biosynthesis
MTSNTKRRLVSIIIPTFNEEANVRTAYEATRTVLDPLHDRYAFEIIFPDNHSTDSSFAVVQALAREDGRVRGVRFARNFGFHRSVLTGYRLSAGDAAIQIDCDLQDPPEVIPEFLERWEQGYDLVVGVRRQRADGQTFHWARKLFYRLLAKMSDDGIVVDSGDFRLLDRTILDQLQSIDDAAPFVRGLTSMLASKQSTVLYDRKPRLRGESKFPLRSLIGLAVNGMLAHSIVPLRVATYTGLVVAMVTFLSTFAYIVGRLVFHVPMPAGFATTTALMLLGITLNALFLGIIGEYVGRIYNQVRARPMTVIEQSVNIDLSSRPVSLRTKELRSYPRDRPIVQAPAEAIERD